MIRRLLGLLFLVKSTNILFFNPHLRIFFIEFREEREERERKKGRERESIHMTEKHQPVCLPYAP